MPELLSAFPLIYSFLVWAPNSIWEVKYLLHRLIQKNTFHGNSFCLVISYTLPNLKNDCVFRLYALTCTEELALEFLHMKFRLSQWVIEQGSAVDSGASIWKDLLMLRVDITHQSWALGAGCRKLLIYRVTSLWDLHKNVSSEVLALLLNYCLKRMSYYFGYNRDGSWCEPGQVRCFIGTYGLPGVCNIPSGRKEC